MYVEGNCLPTTKGLFGRDELIEKILGLAEDLTSIALAGAGGSGRHPLLRPFSTTARHSGNDHQFIRCDRFPALTRLSRIVGAKPDIRKPEDLSPGKLGARVR